LNPGYFQNLKKKIVELRPIPTMANESEFILLYCDMAEHPRCRSTNRELLHIAKIVIARKSREAGAPDKVVKVLARSLFNPAIPSIVKQCPAGLIQAS
jgi:hypothetical protein